MPTAISARSRASPAATRADREARGGARLRRLVAGLHTHRICGQRPRPRALRRLHPGHRERRARARVRGSNIVTVSGFRPDAANLALLHDRGYADMSLLLLDLASGETQFASPANWQSVRWASDGRSLLALTDPGGSDFMRLCRLDPETGAITVYTRPPGATWTLRRCRPMRACSPRSRTTAATPFCASAPSTASALSSPVCRAASSAISLVARRPHARLHRRRARRTDVALAVAGRRGARVGARTCPMPRGFVDYQLVEWPSFDGARIPGWLALPPGAVPPAASRDRLGAWRPGAQTRPGFRPTSRCWWRRASPC